ncbi:hypothetical protein DL93DRAFT_2170127 [Clavulina sp. PMI_390]|nr:hypothetical protein DL93DRAFT_2170127 [Clavulina sp. PMI_390]
MKFAVVLASLAALIPLASAVDYRQLITVPAGYSSGTDFCNDWISDCHTKVTAEASDEFFNSAYCVPGDYQGNNVDTEALAYCVYSKPYTTQLAATEGSTVV